MKHRAFLAAIALVLSACQPKADEAPFTPVAINPFLGDAVLGDPDAPVTIIEYASTTCTHCEAFHRLILPGLKTAYIDTGKAKLIYRVLPTNPGAVSAAGAAIARCAGEKEFFPVLDDLFASQEEILNAARSETRVRKELVRVGIRHGLTEDEIRTCIDDPSIDAYLRKVIAEAPAFVQSTPTLIVDDQHVEEVSPDSMKAAIDAALAKAETPAPAAPAPP